MAIANTINITVGAGAQPAEIGAAVSHTLGEMLPSALQSAIDNLAIQSGAS